jgi:hypothetical protein
MEGPPILERHLVGVRRKQAFRQAPWRAQLRLTGGAALPIITLLVIAVIYLAVNAGLANAGRLVLTLEERRSVLERENGELRTRLAQMTTPQRLMEQARAMGFRPAQPSEIEYVVVDGLEPEPPFVAPSPPSSLLDHPSSLSPAFTETWGEYLSRWLGGDRGESQ